MKLQKPFAVLTPTVDGDVLQVLASANASFSVPQLHRMIPERSARGIRNSLERLAEQGLVTRHQVGPSLAFSLNNAHLAAEPVRQIAGLRHALIMRLNEHVRGWNVPPLFGTIFGSAARGEMRVDSDLDIFLVSPTDRSADAWAADIARLTEAATGWTGNDTRVFDVAADEVGDASIQPLLREILADGVAFAGDPDWLRTSLRAEPTT